MGALPAPVRSFLDAINARNAGALGALMTDDMTYHLIVPHPPVVGRDAVVEVMGRVLTEADQVRWDVVGWASAGDLVYVERVDRFWYGDREAAIECLGVFRVVDGLIAEIRDYADMDTWKERKALAFG
jgi:limonene-1,2-epoxide hydrolase